MPAGIINPPLEEAILAKVKLQKILRLLYAASISGSEIKLFYVIILEFIIGV